MNAAETLEKSIFWQRHILSNSKDLAQQERARRAIEKLEAQLTQARAIK